MSIAVTGSHPQYGGKQNGAFIPELWSGSLLVKFYDATLFGSITNTDYQGMIQDKGDKVIIRTKPDLSVHNYSKGMNLNYEAPTSQEVELTIDHAKYFAFEIKDVDEVQSDINLLNAFSEDGSTQLKIAIDSQILGSIYSQAHAKNAGATAGRISGDINLGTAATPLALTSANILDLIVDFGTVLDEQNVPEAGRFIVLPAWACALIKKSELRDASLSGDGKSMLRNGRIGSVDRFTLYSSNLIHSDAGKFDIIAGHSLATTFATQITKMETVRNTSDFGDYIRALQVFGFKVLKPEALCHAVVQKA